MQKQLHKPHKEHKTVHFAKRTLGSPTYSKSGSRNGIKDATKAAKTYRNDMPIHTELHDIELNQDDSDLWYKAHMQKWPKNTSMTNWWWT